MEFSKVWINSLAYIVDEKLDHSRLPLVVEYKYCPDHFRSVYSSPNLVFKIYLVMYRKSNNNNYRYSR